jgi:hypothetical protein
MGSNCKLTICLPARRPIPTPLLIPSSMRLPAVDLQVPPSALHLVARHRRCCSSVNTNPHLTSQRKRKPRVVGSKSLIDTLSVLTKADNPTLFVGPWHQSCS